MIDDKSSPEKMPPPPPPRTESADDNDNNEETLSREEKLAIERAEEQKLRAKYANVNRPHLGGAGGAGGHSAFLQKRLAKGQKYFDSGDYQMAKQKPHVGGVPAMAGKLSLAIPLLEGPPTGDTIPTPDNVPARKLSIIQPIHDASCVLHVPSDPAHLGATGSTPAVVPGQPLANPSFTKLSS